MHPQQKKRLQQRRKYHIRKTVVGSSHRPRITVFRSHRHFYAQVINDEQHHTLFAASSQQLHLPKKMKQSEKVTAVAAALITAWKKTDYTTFVFDRNGYLYHGHVKAFAEALRQAGMKF